MKREKNVKLLLFETFGLENQDWSNLRIYKVREREIVAFDLKFTEHVHVERDLSRPWRISSMTPHNRTIVMIADMIEISNLIKSHFGEE